MNQNTCKTCKWWQWDSDTEYMAAFGQIKMKYGQPRIQFRCGGTDEMKAADGMVDGEHYDGVFTGPDFGCIHYEETQEQLPQDHPGYAAQQVKLAISGIKETEFMGFKIVCSCDSGPASDCLIHAPTKTIIG